MVSNTRIVDPVTDMLDNGEYCGNKKAGCKFIIVHGEKYKTNFTRKYENRKKWVKPNEKHVISFIPGTITEIFVKEGQTTRKGEKMLLLDAMKMLNTILFPLTGKIKKVNVKVGDKIPKGFLMVEYE
jgi:biotin carboxyl carrier protein